MYWQLFNLAINNKNNNKIVFYFRCRTQILQVEDAKDREKHLVKFIKIMKVSFLMPPE